ncbi:MAG: hypothetical protein KF715_07030 [Candidatus Didemnitutus sp.]|nr:hypothetical protein [Candidatus Didemnitutus sp.]
MPAPAHPSAAAPDSPESRWAWRAWLQRHRGGLLMFAAFALFLVYGSCRQRYIWGVDSFGYYELGKVISEGRITLPLHFESVHKSPLTPWGFLVREQGVPTPSYPPGFPLLLALGHLVRAPLWVTPAIGVLSCALLLRLLRRRTSEAVALLLTAAWALMPLTVYGSTMLMSDLVAATTLMGGLLAWQQGRLGLAAWIFSFSFAVRPTNVLFFVPLLLVLPRDRTSVRFLLHFIVPCAIYAVYNTLLYGRPWRTGYGNIMVGMEARIFPEFFAFFLRTTWELLTPIVIGFAALAFVRPSRERFFLLAWWLTFVGFYSFWAGGGADRWWWARFILPGMAGLFLLAGDGCEWARQWMGKTFPHARWVAVLPLLLIAVLPFAYLRDARNRPEIWRRDTGLPNHLLVEKVCATVPEGSLIGTLEHASSFYLYSSLVPFVCIDPAASELVDEALRHGRRVFVLPEPWHVDHPEVRELLTRFSATEAGKFDTPWAGQTLYELKLR